MGINHLNAGNIFSFAILKLFHSKYDISESKSRKRICGDDALETITDILCRYLSRSLGAIILIAQSAQLENPDARFTFKTSGKQVLLSSHAACYAGIQNGDASRFQRFFWEISDRKDLWHFQQATVPNSTFYGGRELIIYFDLKSGHLRETAEIRRQKLHDSDQRGNQAWGRAGIVVSQMNSLQVTLYTGELYDQSCAVILPNNSSFVPAIWAYCSSPAFNEAVRRIDKKLNVTNATLVKVPFDLAHWQSVADKMGPLPEPHSDDPTQWLFKGNVAGSTSPLQVAVARLLGYRWPEQALDQLCDEDGIVCLPAVRGEQPAADRLRALLAAAYGADFSPATLAELLSAAGHGDKTLEQWLRDGFFENHCSVFHQRPFLWHIWDGRRDGFAALVNYHKLDRRQLETLIYTYLGDWIRQQEADRENPTAEARLLAARELQHKLKLMLAGESPYDIFVRWKPLEQQPIGWEPDLNDGVRLNIRPFVEAGVLCKKPNIKWGKDRGRNPVGAPWGEERNNDLHLTLEEKRRAREQKGAST